ncbi:RsmB/NOP family class I SAM-dependent RNA methyltransferase [Parenemella sanctibonifatiensis]|uniref:rRNA cytosine-C5-methylase n=1 Tax=Parenemella sanctibonifatiensis TaxID=2016505 RepID=A0A255E6C0_9ACTN|nr:RsmB/NOP family class I SAM-dependent RNA methyltransferase [Parenemella sanctibonifatiensis]OYN86501.1 rRNA cytosine-C5-methylase [Parenemella sanctibonifatiensis]
MSRPRRRRKVDAARLAAYTALHRISVEDAYANLVLRDATRGLAARDASWVTEVVSGTSRLRGTYDRIITEAGGRPVEKLQSSVLDVLRMASHQALSMRTPAHAVVSESVDLAAQVVGERVTGLVNAVTRKILAKDLAGWTEQLTGSADPELARSIRHHHPAWIVHAYQDSLPADEVELALAANNIAPATQLVARPGLVTRDELLAEAVEVGLSGDPIDLVSTAITVAGDPGKLPSVITGRAAVQDAGSQLVTLALTRALAAEAGQRGSAPRVLDLCAGPGGKSALLATAVPTARLLAAELHPHRAELVRSSLRTVPHDRWAVICADGTQPAWAPNIFDAVLADVPCTGLGALRRRPESRWRRTDADLTELVALQRSLLDVALDAVRPGGIVGYVTCSPHPAETVEVVDEIRATRGDVEVVAPTGMPDDARRGDYVQLWPHRHGTDAMFLALLRRR